MNTRPLGVGHVDLSCCRTDRTALADGRGRRRFGHCRLLIALALVACGSAGTPVDRLDPKQHYVLIPGTVALFEGHATETLYAILDHQGIHVSMAEVALSTPKARSLNELCGQLVAWGLEARVVPATFDAFKQTIDQQQPIVVESDGGYAIGIGYNPDDKQAVLAAPGGKKILIADLKKASPEMIVLLPQPGRQYRQLARHHAAQGDLVTALGMYRQAVQADPKDWQARLEEGHCLVLLRRLDEAKAAYEAVLAERQEDPDAMAGLAGVLYHKNENPEQALTLATEAVKRFEARLKNDGSPLVAAKLGQALSTLADLHQSAGRTQEAADALKKSMEYIPVELRATRWERIRALKRASQPDSK